MRWSGKEEEWKLLLCSGKVEYWLTSFGWGYLGNLCIGIFEYFLFCSSALWHNRVRNSSFFRASSLNSYRDTNIIILILENAMRVCVCECCLSLSLCMCVVSQNNSPLFLSWQGARYRRLRVATWVFCIRFDKRIHIYIRIRMHTYSSWLVWVSFETLRVGYISLNAFQAKFFQFCFLKFTVSTKC